MNQLHPVTVVTGGSRGIGAAIVRELATAGHDVVVNYRADAAAADLAVRQAEHAGARAIAVQADVTRDDDVERLLTQAAERLGAVTGLVNNAGATSHIGDLADTPLDAVRSVLDLNLWATILCCRRATQLMSTTRGGSGGAIVNISSAAATLGSPHEYVHYAAAKAGVDALTIGLAKELGRDGVRVNAVAPGIVETQIHADAGEPERVARVGPGTPLGRAAVPGDIAPAVAWLLSPAASYVTGAILRIAGGR